MSRADGTMNPITGNAITTRRTFGDRPSPISSTAAPPRQPVIATWVAICSPGPRCPASPAWANWCSILSRYLRGTTRSSRAANACRAMAAIRGTNGSDIFFSNSPRSGTVRKALRSGVRRRPTGDCDAHDDDAHHGDPGAKEHQMSILTMRRITSIPATTETQHPISSTRPTPL